MKKNNVKTLCDTMDKLYTKLTEGKLVVFIRHYTLGNYNKWYYYKGEDTIVSSTPIMNPVPQWNGEPFLDYTECFIGNLSYKEYCKEVDKKSMFVFHDFTRCSNRMFEAVERLQRFLS